MHTWIIFPATASILALSMLVCSCNGQSETDAEAQTPEAPEPARKEVLDSPLAGRWFSADKSQLAREIQGYLNNVKEDQLSEVMALILPHAGYRFSGQTAAYGIRQLAGKHFKRVIIMGPSHSVTMQNFVSVPAVTHYATPLGEIPLDCDFIAELRKHPEFRNVPRAHRGEHSVQIEIPLLQAVLKDFQLVPMVVGQLDAQTTRRIADVLKGLVDDETLVIASSDFTHYGPNFGYVPFAEDIPNRLRSLDMGAFEFINAGDMTGFYDYIQHTGATICGRCPIAILLGILPESAQTHLLHYDTSGNITGDFQNSVSYLSAAITGAWGKGGGKTSSAREKSPTLNAIDKDGLLRLARRTLGYYMKNGERPSPKDLGIEITPAMQQVMGAFVTLHENGNLRGCIGEIFPRRELYEAVMDHALNAGLNDRRFRPVVEDELPLLDFEISALSPPQPVDSYKDIIIGKHGVVVRKRGRQAVYLPQVAPEQGWNVEQTLTHLCQKAGLPPDAWKQDAEFLVFEAIVFGEKKHE